MNSLIEAEENMRDKVNEMNSQSRTIDNNDSSFSQGNITEQKVIEYIDLPENKNGDPMNMVNEDNKEVIGTYMPREHEKTDRSKGISQKCSKPRKDTKSSKKKKKKNETD